MNLTPELRAQIVQVCSSGVPRRTVDEWLLAYEKALSKLEESIVGEELEWQAKRIAELEAALTKMVATFGMHGPCRNHSCSDCRSAYKAALKALEVKT